MTNSDAAASRRSFLAMLAAGGALSAVARPSVGAAPPAAALYHAGAQATISGASLLVTPPLGVVTLNRMGYGPRPGDVAAFEALGSTDDERLTAYVDQQLDPASIDDSALEARLADPAYQTLNKSLTTLWAEHVRPPERPWSEKIRPTQELQLALLMRAVYSKRQLVEVLAEFWRDHFNIYGFEQPMTGLTVAYDRDAIRPHIFGNFRDMLEANATHTAMLYYLDNYASSDEGPNENYGRELLELHTMGAENYLGVTPQWEVPLDGEGRPIGFVEGDVLEVARCFTGWSVSNGHWSDPYDPDTGEFYYRPSWHDRFLKYVLGEFLPADQDALVDGLRVLEKLAEHPGTATHVCRKLCRRLIADDPPETIVSSAAQVFHDNWQAPDQLKLVTRHILLSQEFRNTWSEKVKRPFETVASAMRACEADLTLKLGESDTNTFVWLYGATGHEPFRWHHPNGYPDSRAVWQSTTATVMSWRVMNWLLSDTNSAGGRHMDVLATTLAAFPDPATRTPNNLAAFWYGRILGYAPDSAQVAAAAQLLTHSDSYTGSWGVDVAVDLDQDSWPHYWQSGLRSLVGLILMGPEFLQR